MGIDTGFDMVRRLSKGAVDTHNWQSFIKIIQEHYQNDDLVEVKPNYIVLKAGEHPRLPFEGQQVLALQLKDIRESRRRSRGIYRYGHPGRSG
jgi:hypothetical protein